MATQTLNVNIKKQREDKIISSLCFCGAGGGTRTHTPSRIIDFESISSANSNTPASKNGQFCRENVEKMSRKLCLEQVGNHNILWNLVEISKKWSLNSCF